MKTRIAATLLAATLSLSACQGSDERAEEFYRSGLELLEQGDRDRAAVEFRNVFRYDGTHQDARTQLAEILLADGDIRGGYGQYLRLAEQYPDDPAIRRELARIAISQQNWEEAERHGREAIALDPEPLEARAIRVALDYRQAALDEDAVARAEQVREARAILQEDPENLVVRRVVIAEEIEAGQLTEALDDLDAAIAIAPDVIEYGMLKLRVLSALGDRDAIDAHLREMYERFPDDENIQQILISWYLQQDDFDAAETFLRGLAGDDTGPAEGHVTVIRFLEEARGREAAQAEVERLIAANAEMPENAALYRSMQAAYMFEDGERDQAISRMREIVETAPASEQTRRLKGGLAKMLLATGNRTGARALIEEILAEDTSNVVALKLRGAMLIENDEPAQAIIDLRRALDQSPRDTETILLLADAHERDGSTELQGERLALAVDVSNAGPTESLRYAAFLLRGDRRSAARSVLANARSANPGNVDILVQSARLALEGDTPGLVRGIIGDLELIENDPRAAEAARSLETALLLQEGRVDDGLAMLEERAEQDGGAAAVLAIVRTQVTAGKIEEARRYLDEMLAASPDDPDLRQIDAGLASIEGDPERTERILREILEDDPRSTGVARQLYGLLLSSGRPDEATEVLDATIAANPDELQLRALKAGELERAGDVPGAIAVYEEIYARDSSNVVIANNLASLLSGQEGDAETLERAAAVARRLRGSSVPAFQDTYGWIAYRQGNVREALDYLEPAAAGLPDDPLVQYHLGMTYVAQDRTEEAATALNRALELAGDNPPPQMDDARATLSDLETATGTETGATETGAETGETETGAETDAPDPAAAATTE